jgi:hypothetical protein
MREHTHSRERPGRPGVMGRRGVCKPYKPGSVAHWISPNRPSRPAYTERVDGFLFRITSAAPNGRSPGAPEGRNSETWYHSAWRPVSPNLAEFSRVP